MTHPWCFKEEWREKIRAFCRGSFSQQTLDWPWVSLLITVCTASSPCSLWMRHNESVLSWRSSMQIVLKDSSGPPCRCDASRACWTVMKGNITLTSICTVEGDYDLGRFFGEYLFLLSCWVVERRWIPPACVSTWTGNGSEPRNRLAHNTIVLRGGCYWARLTFLINSPKKSI